MGLAAYGCGHNRKQCAWRICSFLQAGLFLLHNPSLQSQWCTTQYNLLCSPCSELLLSGLINATQLFYSDHESLGVTETTSLVYLWQLAVQQDSLQIWLDLM